METASRSVIPKKRKDSDACRSPRLFIPLNDVCALSSHFAIFTKSHRADTQQAGSKQQHGHGFRDGGRLNRRRGASAEQLYTELKKLPLSGGGRKTPFSAAFRREAVTR